MPPTRPLVRVALVRERTVAYEHQVDAPARSAEFAGGEIWRSLFESTPHWA